MVLVFCFPGQETKLQLCFPLLKLLNQAFRVVDRHMPQISGLTPENLCQIDERLIDVH
jgi:hypothetical protein